MTIKMVTEQISLLNQLKGYNYVVKKTSKYIAI